MELLDKIKKSFVGKDYEDIMQAYYYAQEMHAGQLRKSGEPFFVHPCSVADILLEYNLDKESIMASLLHDVVEDTEAEACDIEKRFGKEVLTLVEGVTKLAQIQFKSEEDEQAENMRKMFFAMSKDVRILLIKLADRLHNMRTLSALSPDRQIAMAKETMEIYAPLAGRLGISNLKVELDDLSMKFLYPEDYKNLVKLVAQKKEERKEFVDKVCSILKDKLVELGIAGEVWGRPKHLYSIYKKMHKQGKSFDQIYDLIAVRVIVNDIKECYSILGSIHSMWKPLPGRFKDYIAMPKPNNYQSLHTTVMTKFGEPFEIQIRTHQMHRIAEYGIAAHWRYKEGGGRSIVDEKLAWLREAMEVQGEVKDSKEFINGLKIDLFDDEVFVFTPKGDVINLPVGSTILDFAYAIHSAVGNKCVSGKINNRIMPIDTQLKTGDIIEIITSNNSKGPSRDWLKIVKTAQARAKIRQFFKKEMLEENIKNGKDILEREAKRKGFNLSELMQPAWLEIIMQKYSFSSVDELYASVGYGGITSNKILLRLLDFKRQDEARNATNLIIDKPDQVRPRQKNATGGIIIKGYDDFAVRLSKCCAPVPGDQIVGYISRGRGVSIHRKDCPNMKNIQPERLMEAKWPTNISDSFEANVMIKAYDREGLLGDMLGVLSAQKVPIRAVSAKTDKNEATIVVSIQVNGTDVLDNVIKKIKTFKDVQDVFRT